MPEDGPQQQREFVSSFPAEELTPERQAGAEFLAGIGLGHMAGMEIEAHGKKMLLMDAPSQCQPFANMLSVTAEVMKDVPGAVEKLETIVLSSAAKTKELRPDIEQPQSMTNPKKKLTS